MKKIIKTKKNLYVYSDSEEEINPNTWQKYIKEGFEFPFGYVTHWEQCKEPIIKEQNIISIFELDTLAYGKELKNGEREYSCSVRAIQCPRTLEIKDIYNFVKKFFDDFIDNHYPDGKKGKIWQAKYVINQISIDTWNYYCYYPKLEN
jgi:hypothetical protein